MTKADKKVFIDDLCMSIKNDLLDKVDQMPEEWNGVELRELLYEKFKDARHGFFTSNPRSKRAKEYKNHIMTHNL
jgi:hypothetical protein